MSEVSTKLISQFVSALEEQVLAGYSSAADPVSQPRAETQTTARGTVDTTNPMYQRMSASEPVDLLAVAGGSVVKRLVPVGIGLLGIIGVVIRLQRRR
jgi:hypothetical protein